MWCRSWAHAFQVCPSFKPVVGPLLTARTRTRRGLGPGVFSPTSCPEHSDCPLNLSPLPGLSGTALFSLQTSPWENLLCPMLFSACLLSPCKCLVLGHMAGFRSSTWECVWAAFGGTFRSQVSSCPMTFWETGVAISTVSVDLAVSLALLLAQSSVCYINFQHGSVLLMSWHFHPQKWLSLSLVILAGLKSPSSDTETPAFYFLVFSQHSFPCPFILNLFVILYL